MFSELKNYLQKDEKSAIDYLKERFKDEYYRKSIHGLSDFLYMYVTNQCQSVNPRICFKMMRYFGADNSNEQSGEIGFYMMTRMQILKRREGKNQCTIGLNNSAILCTPAFYIKSFNDIMKEAQPVKKYELMKDIFLCMSDENIKWFARFLCNKVEKKQIFHEIIKHSKLFGEDRKDGKV